MGIERGKLAAVAIVLSMVVGLPWLWLRESAWCVWVVTKSTAETARERWRAAKRAWRHA
jgi:hypothetical protein